jgi:hypothetical protein
VRQLQGNICRTDQRKLLHDSSKGTSAGQIKGHLFPAVPRKLLPDRSKGIFPAAGRIHFPDSSLKEFQEINLKGFFNL